MGVDYGWEKFYSAMRYAAASSDSVQRRLAGVIMQVSLLDRGHFPNDEEWQKFEELIKETTKTPARGDEGTIQATTSKMTEDEASGFLHTAFDIFNQMAWSYGAENSESFKPV